MTLEQMKLAAQELRARASMNIGEPVGERCLALAKALEELSEGKAPYAWEVTKGGRSSLVTAEEFTRNTYERGSLKPLYVN